MIDGRRRPVEQAADEAQAAATVLDRMASSSRTTYVIEPDDDEPSDEDVLPDDDEPSTE